MAGEWHIDPEVEAALVHLDDEICTFERATDRQYTLILVPHSPDEKIIMSQNGKPLPQNLGMEPREILEIAMRARKGG